MKRKLRSHIFCFFLSSNYGNKYLLRVLSTVTSESSEGAQMVKNLPAVQETWVLSLGWEDPQGKVMATHSSTLAWRIPRTEGLVGYSPRGPKESDATASFSAVSYSLRPRGL